MRRLIATAFAALTLTTAFSAHAEIKFGVMANRGELQATTEWTDFVSYLSEKVGQPVKLVTFNIDKTFDMAANKQVDFILTNPVQAAGLQEKHGAKPLVSWSRKGETAFGGVIIASTKSGVTTAAQVKGKKVIAYNPESAGAFVFQRYYLMKKGVDVNKDVAALQYTKKQDDVVLAVKSGLMDVGFVRTGVLESMVAAGRMSMSDVVVVDPVSDPKFKQARTTVLYPDWFISAMAGTDPAVAAKVKDAAKALTADSPVAKAANVDGFIDALPLGDTVDMLKTLKMAPFDK